MASEGTPLTHSMNGIHDQNCISYGEYEMQVPQRIARLAPQFEYRQTQVSAIPRQVRMHPPPVQGVSSYYPAAMAFANQESLPHLTSGEYNSSR